jgi:hypothetical protein
MIPDYYDPRKVGERFEDPEGRRLRRASSSLAVFVVTNLSKTVWVKWKLM